MGANWKDEDQAAAAAQGWNVFEQEDGSFTIGSDEDVPAFVEDAEASAYVCHSAHHGAPLAIRARFRPKIADWPARPSFWLSPSPHGTGSAFSAVEQIASGEGGALLCRFCVT